MSETPKFLTLEQIKAQFPPKEEMVGKGDQTAVAKIYRNETGEIVYIEPGFGTEIIARKKVAAKKEE